MYVLLRKVLEIVIYTIVKFVIVQVLRHSDIT